MSSSQLVDGRTGEPIGYNAYSNNYVTTTTSNYVPAGGVTTSNYAYGSGSGYGDRVERVERVEGRVGAVEGRVGSTQVVGTTVNTGKEVIKGESRIEYVPFEKKIVEYKDQAKVERVPKKVKRVEYKEERKVETIPREVTVTDYYAVEYLRQYIPQYVPEKKIEYVQVPKKQVRYEYIPVERQIVHYPDQALEAEGRVQTRVEGGYRTEYAQPAVEQRVVYETVPDRRQEVVYETVPGRREEVVYEQPGVRREEVVYTTGPQYEQKYYSSYPAGEVARQEYVVKRD